jgi:hypothetical protein
LSSFPCQTSTFFLSPDVPGFMSAIELVSISTKLADVAFSWLHLRLVYPVLGQKSWEHRLWYRRSDRKKDATATVTAT